MVKFGNVFVIELDDKAVYEVRMMTTLRLYIGVERSDLGFEFWGTGLSWYSRLKEHLFFSDSFVISDIVRLLRI
jgi:hypothetical protein